MKLKCKDCKILLRYYDNDKNHIWCRGCESHWWREEPEYYNKVMEMRDKGEMFG